MPTQRERRVLLCMYFLLLLQATSLFYKWYMRRLGRRFVRRVSYRHRNDEREAVFDRFIRGSDRACRENVRMNRSAFYRLCGQLRNYGLTDSRYVTGEEQVALFLMIVGQDWRNRNTVNRFFRSGQTIHHYFHVVLDLVVRMYKDVVKAPTARNGPKDGGADPGWWHYFKDAVGVIDGTHFDANIPIVDQNRYRNRKGNVSQNVLVAVSFDMKFTYVLAGWEGSAHDGRVLRCAVTREGRRLTLPQGKYYLADAGYANVKGFLTPYRGVRYHLKQYTQDQENHNQPQNAEELFNLRHSSLRNVVVRTIGVLKRRWAYLRHPTFHDVQTQTKIVVACCALHNFLRCVDPDDDDISCSSDSDTSDDEDDDNVPEPEEMANYENMVIAATPQWTSFRDELASNMWFDYINGV